MGSGPPENCSVGLWSCRSPTRPTKKNGWQAADANPYGIDLSYRRGIYCTTKQCGEEGYEDTPHLRSREPGFNVGVHMPTHHKPNRALHACRVVVVCLHWVLAVLQVVAGTFNVVKAGRFYGRYWGAFETVKNLHFEACCESVKAYAPRSEKRGY